MTVRVVCSSCEAVYNVPEDRVTSEVVRATCKVCGNEFEIRREDTESGAVETTEGGSPLPPIPRDPDDKPTGTWQKAVIDNTEADKLLGVDSTTIPPSPADRGEVDEATVDDPAGPPRGSIQNLGDQVISSREDLDRVFPEHDPVPPAGLDSAPPPASAPPKSSAAQSKKKRSRAKKSLPFRIMKVFVYVLTLGLLAGAGYVVARMFELI